MAKGSRTRSEAKYPEAWGVKGRESRETVVEPDSLKGIFVQVKPVLGPREKFWDQDQPLKEWCLFSICAVP